MFFFSNLCIVCLNTCKNLKNVLIQDEEGILIQKKLKYCLPEIVDCHLEIPKYICINCISLLDCFYKFKQWCLRNSTIMTNYLRTLTSPDETYKYLSVSLTDIKSQSIQQAVSMDQTFSDVENDDEIRSERKEDNETCVKETETVFKNKTKLSHTLDIRNSHPLYNKEKDIIVKEEHFIFEDLRDFEFYHETVKNIKYESIPSDSDDSVSYNEYLEEDSEDSNQSNENIFTNHEENTNDWRKTNILKCLICNSREFLHIHELKRHLEAHAVSTHVSKNKVNQSESLKVNNVETCGSSNTDIDDIENNHNFADLVLVQLPADNPSNSPTYNSELMDTSELPIEKDIKCNDEVITRKEQVASQGCLAIQEPTSLAVNTNSLLDVLGGFDGTTFTVTVKRRVSDAARAAEECGVCRAAVTQFLFHDEAGWRCERCMPTYEACKNQNKGCTYIDFSSKCRKHLNYFCQQRIECWICDATVSRGSWAVHYSMHQEITSKAGSTWRVRKSLNSKYRLIPSAAGTAICTYWLGDSYLQLWAYIPVSSERLKEFRCVVRVTDPATGHEHTVTPDVVYNDYCDWCITINKSEFSSWNIVFNVSVDITKK